MIGATARIGTPWLRVTAEFDCAFVQRDRGVMAALSVVLAGRSA